MLWGLSIHSEVADDPRHGTAIQMKSKDDKGKQVASITRIIGDLELISKKTEDSERVWLRGSVVVM